MNIQDSTALVTGANRGIGKEFADALLDRGAAKVYAAVRDVATVGDPRLVPIQLDVTDPDRVAAVAGSSTTSSWSSTTPEEANMNDLLDLVRREIRSDPFRREKP